jgi:CDP-diacylglycerol---glycerol-3-phosphate 3-phosphatidyltransferase
VTAVWAALFERRSREAPDEMRDTVWTVATGITLARATISTSILVFAAFERVHWLLLAGFGVSMALDVLDGHVARARREETILGAQLDGLADRLAALLVLAGTVYLTPTPEVAVAAGIVWLQYGSVEQLLNGQFLRFGLWSPDHFYEESRWVWWLNWSAPAKVASGAPLLLIALGAWAAAAAASLLLIAMRIPCYAGILAAARSMPETRPLAEEGPATAPQTQQVPSLDPAPLGQVEDRLAA